MASPGQHGQSPDYYRPYLPSDSELSDAESEGSSWTRASTPRPGNANPDYIDPREPSPDYKLLAEALNRPLTLPAGPSFVTEKQEDFYATRKLDPRTTYHSYKQPTRAELEAQLAYESTITAETTSNVQTVIMLQSRNRDKSIFPNPTACQLFLPRDYKRVVGFSIAQINLTSAFFYFSKLKSNVDIQIYEQNQIVYNCNSQPILTPSGDITPRYITNSIRDGSYNITQLLQELTIQLNKVPLFYDFINGFSDFLPLFQVNGDYSLNFNYPGDYYYDATNKIYIQNPTRAQITSYYFQSQYANLFTYTIQQVRVAYYYPVLKEALLDPDTVTDQLNLSGTGLSTADTINYLLYQFQGINDPIATTVINNNIPWLDNYRLGHTFRYSLVNKYVCGYNATNNRVSITTPSLNTSLVNLLNAQYNTYLTQQLAKYQISAAQYNTLAAQNTQILSILQSMYDYLQVQLAIYFAINYGTFSRGYYADSNNTILLRNGLDASGIAIRYDANVAPTPRDTNLIEDFRTNPPYYWPRMKDLSNVEGAQRNMGSISQPFPQSSNFPYSVQSSNIDFTKNFIDATGTIYTDVRTRSGDILVNVDPGKYTIFQFRSKYRQTLQVETLPRQTAFRYPEWNAACNVPYPIQPLFDASYCYVDPGSSISNVTPFDISYNSIAGWYATPSTANFGIGSNDSFNYWGTSSELINIVNSNGRYYTFTTPLPVWPKGSNEYVYTLNLTLTTSNGTDTFNSDLLAFFYQDIGSFSADLSGIRHENPVHYKQVFSTIGAVTTETTYTFTAYANQQYYLLVRAASLTPPATTYRIVPWFPDGSYYSTLSTSVVFNPLDDPTTMLNNVTVAKVADPNFIRMPIEPSTLYGTNPANDPINLPLTANPVPIGYDGSNVSNDLTDYVPFAPNNTLSSINPVATIRADPINNYLFQYNSPYSATQDSYFYPGSSNAIMSKNGIAQYTPGKVNARQYKLVNWYSPNFIQDNKTTLSYNPASTTQYALAYTSSTTSTPLFGYQYGGSNSALQLGTGVSGFTFLPTDGTWAIDRITFKTNFIDPLASDTNYIHVLGVFYTSEVTSRAVSYINLSNALAICLRTGIQTYSNSTNLNLGFDAQLGSYYTYSNFPELVTRTGSNAVISGFAQQSKTFITDSNAYYSVVAFQIPAYSNYKYFNQSTIAGIGISNIRTQLTSAVADHIQNLMGSPIAYPYANNAYSALTFYDNKFSPTGQGVVRSTSNGNNTIYGPPQGADESISQYEQSIPFVNSHLHYLNPTNIIADVSGFTAWSNLPVTAPSYILPSIPNYMLFQDTAFTLCYYSTNGTITRDTPPSRDFIVKGQIAVQQIFPDYENTSLVATSGNTYEYCFLGMSNNLATPGLSQLRFKTYNITTGIIEELPMNPAYTFCNDLQIQHFVYSDSRSWYLTAANIPSNYTLLQGDQQYNSTVTITNISNIYSGNTYSELQMVPQGSLLYLGLAPTENTGFSTMTVWNLATDATVGKISTTAGLTITLKTGGTLPPYYKQIAVTLNDTIEEVLLTNIAYKPYKYYKIRNYTSQTPTSCNTSIDESVENFTNSNNVFISPTRIFGGGGGSKWVLFDDAPYLFGNRNDAYDAPTSLNIAWQIFFPTVKVEMRKLTNGTSPIVDLTGITYPEWPHTAMFAYSNETRLIADLFGNGEPNKCTWGNESKSNFWVSDVSFNGFYFNSYMMNVPLLPSSGTSPCNDYYIAVRGWLPTEKFQTMMRFYLPNRYDFGFARIRDAEDEVFLAMSNPSEFNPTYLTTLLAFNSNFVFTNRNFGSNPTSGFAGSNLSSSNFKDYMTQYAGYYSTFTANTAILEQITSTVNTSINNFIATDLQYVLPSTALTRQRFTDPLLFQIRWKSQLTPQFLTLEDQWGLGWNLGYTKQDTSFATIHIGESFYKIQDDFIYLRLNPEFNINRMDAGGKENYKESREPTGFVNQYYCKLLLTSFGGNATTFIHNPIQFNPTIYKLSKLEFQWVDQNGNTITNADAEWDMVVNITEQVDTVPPERRKVKFTTNPPFTPANPRDASPMDIPKDSELLSELSPFAGKAKVADGLKPIGSDGAEELQAKANQEAAKLYKEERTTLEQEQARPIMLNTQTGGVRPDYPAWLPAYDRRLRQQRLAVPEGATTQLEPAWKP